MWDAETFKRWAPLTYPRLAAQVLRDFVTPEEIPDAALEKITDEAFALWDGPRDERGGYRTGGKVVPVRRVGPYHVAELFHGPSLAFKDFGQQLLCRLLNYFAARDGVQNTVLVSTTGDTGPAVLSAAAACPHLRVICCFPAGQVTRWIFPLAGICIIGDSSLT